MIGIQSNFSEESWIPIGKFIDDYMYVSASPILINPIGVSTRVCRGVYEDDMGLRVVQGRKFGIVHI